MSFDGINQATIVHKKDFSGQLNNDFIIRMWMKHSDQEVDEKEHIFCKSDEKCKEIFFFLFKKKRKHFFLLLVMNRHHTALFIQNGYLKLLIRKGPISSNDNKLYASEWIWKLSQINDDQWHLYKLSVNYPNKVLYSFSLK